MDPQEALQEEEEKEGLTLNPGIDEQVLGDDERIPGDDEWIPGDEQVLGDDEWVEALLGRVPRGSYEVVVRADDGTPRVLRNAPFLDDGTPMPTRYWLVGPDDVRRVSRLEAAGGVRRAEAAVDPGELADAHRRYAAERDRAIPDDHRGHRPSAGVGGTRRGVKCLHAHYAWHLAGGDDPVGRWVAEHLDSKAPA